MTWTAAELRQALQADGLNGMQDAAAAEALAAETRQEVRDVATSDARALLLRTGEWGGLVMLARRTPADLQEGQAIGAAITAEDTLRLTETLQATDPAYFGAMQQMCAVLEAAGVVSHETATELLELRNVNVPVWDPPPSAADVAAARAMEG